MARKLMTWKVPTVASLSNGFTYIALTGSLLTAMVTSGPVLPPAVEAKAAAPAVNVVGSQASPLTSQMAKPSQQQAVAADMPQQLEATDIAPSQADVLAGPPGRIIVEARARLKTVKAKDAPEKSERPGKRRSKAPPADDSKDSNDKDSKEDDANAAKEPAGHEADVHIEETDTPADRNKASRSAPPAPTAVVPVESTKPVDPKAPPTAWTDADVMTALKECLRLLSPVEVEAEANPAMRKGDCGTPAPILLKSIGSNPKIVLQPAAEVNCPMAVALSQWASDTLQPAAKEAFSGEVTRIVGSSGYSCRNRYGLADERLSEHALANAIDIAGFALANGKVVTVAKAWGGTERDRVAAAKAREQAKAEAQAKAETKEKDAGKKKASGSDAPTPSITAKDRVTRTSAKTDDAKDRDSGRKKPGKDRAEDSPAPNEITVADGAGTAEGRFLRRLHKGACDTFGTVLGPEANEAHRDHFHFDLKARKRRAVCH
jgi:hypothetical protein